MFNQPEDRLSKIPEPTRRSSIASQNSRNQNSNENKSFFHKQIITPFLENPLICTSVCMILISSLFLFILLVGGSRAIYLSSFTFDEPIKFIAKKNYITFTLYGYCVDDQCSKPSLTHDFGKLPDSSEITGDLPNNKRFDVSQTASDAGKAASDVGKGVGNTINNNPTINNAGKTVKDTIDDIAQKAPGLLSALLSAFENFKPKISTTNIIGFFSIPYVLSLVVNALALILLYFHFSAIATLFLLISTTLNAVALFLDILLFVWVFDLIAVIPGIGSQHTGPGIYLAGWSFFFLGIATLLLIVRLRNFYKGLIKDVIKSVMKSVMKLRKPKVATEHVKKEQEMTDLA